MKDHRIYNERLVNRGEILISKEAIGNWDNELAVMMNRGKEGRRPYAYLESFMRMVAHSMFYFRLPYRQMEGLLRTYNCNNCNGNNCNCKGIFPMIPDYTSIQRRICKLEKEIRCQERRKRRAGNNSIILAIDSTGISVTNRGQWMRSKWGRKGHTESRGFLKIHVASDMHTGEVLALRITDDRTPDCRCLEGLVSDARKTGVAISCVMADGAYDSRQIFSFLDEMGIDPVIRVHRNSVAATNRDCPARMNAVMRQANGAYDRWRDSASYGMRWTVESVFSSLKRMFGEAVRSRNKENMATELMLKIGLYNRFVREMVSAG